jgi:GTPase SAR1 family protein
MLVRAQSLLDTLETSLIQLKTYKCYYFKPTIGIDFISKNIAVAGKMIRLQLWDTAGQ